MDYSFDTPPHVTPHTPYLKPVDDIPFNNPTTPSSLTFPPPASPPKTPSIPTDLTQTLVNANHQLKRFQQDLLILTSFHDTSTLHWRPFWFPQEPNSTSFWTLYNPPNVVTELLPHARLGRLVYTRRMRRPSDAEPVYVKTWAQWERVCDLRGVPRDYLSEEQVGLMRMGLARDAKGEVVAPPTYPLYPEPQSLGHGRYILTPNVYISHLPRKFHDLRTSADELEEARVVVVHSNGALKIEPREDFFMHESQWTHFNGQGGYVADVRYVPDFGAPKDQATGRRWSYIPWTREMEESCRLVVKFKVRVQEWE